MPDVLCATLGALGADPVQGKNALFAREGLAEPAAAGAGAAAYGVQPERTARDGAYRSSSEGCVESRCAAERNGGLEGF